MPIRTFARTQSPLLLIGESEESLAGGSTLNAVSSGVPSQASPITITVNNVQRRTTGLFRISFRASVTMATAGATLTCTIQRDAVTIPSSPSCQEQASGAGANQIVQIALDFVDTAPDDALHSYSFVLTSSAGNMTIAASGANIIIAETL